VTTCYCDGPPHPWRPDFCGRIPTRDPDTKVEQGLRLAREQREEIVARLSKPIQVGLDFDGEAS
jgi:hypothetical protein